ncbi:energy transducer TonB [Ralstonia solanacearum]|uniref:energy transducer TonB family protein n=1 Tax=Ralstonia solanacearum TaxID=305 RepID=UPI0005C485AF|nr:energy transducer TonB [Ralstonia solanacearum]MBB6590330.1 energy transducer TonB [Ralstonia solanacearum]MBB6594528.1 energy transducer TonB [Ralstonia solanacearum]MDB0539669.1 energy transducer TonB [Ralstonia solanacearum]MDB0549540.1 energy transducer TonB [Ralstonia solanacearum]MDB0554642.1 energy transducer TonB [Ralstonia solanacearum]
MAALANHPDWSGSSTLTKALVASLILHILLLFVRVVAPEAFDIKRDDPGLDVVLVNAKSSTAPAKPTAVAQVNLNGGGEYDRQRATTPLPAETEQQTGDVIKLTQRRIEFLEEEQRRLLTQSRRAAPLVNARTVKPGEQPQPSPTNGTDDRTTQDEIARLQAEIDRNLENYAKRPRRNVLTAASARQVDYARYYDAVRRKIETRGTANFPSLNGRPLYGELIVVISVNRDGQLGYNQDGYKIEGIEVAKSSGNPALDRQAVAIVRSSAPFGAFPAEMRKRVDIQDVVATFKFTRAGLETQLQTR